MKDEVLKMFYLKKMCASRIFSIALIAAAALVISAVVKLNAPAQELLLKDSGSSAAAPQTATGAYEKSVVSPDGERARANCPKAKTGGDFAVAASGAASASDTPAQPVAAAAPEACAGEDFVPGDILIRLKSGFGAVDDFAAAHKLSIKENMKEIGVVRTAINIEGLSDEDARAATLNTCASLSEDKQVEFAEVNGIMNAEPPGPDPMAGQGNSCTAKEFVAGDILLKLKPNARTLEIFAKEHGLAIKQKGSGGPALVGVNIAGLDKEKALALTRDICVSLNNDAEVEYADLNGIKKQQ